MVKGKKAAADSEDYSTWTVLELRDTLKSNNLSTDGNKKQLIARLKAAPVKEYSEYSVVELRDLLADNGLSTKGNKKDLIKRLENYDENGTDSEQKEESEEEEESDDNKKSKRKKNSLTGTKRKSTGKESSKSPARKKAKTSLKFEEENIYCDDEIPSFNTGDFNDSNDFPKSIVCKAENGRSKCKSCRANIRKDSVRVGTQHKGKEAEEVETRWYHVRCLQVPKKITKPSDIKNYNTCGSELQDLIAQQFKKTKISPVPASPKKSPKNSKSAETAARKKKFKQACASLGNLTVADLKAILKRNNQRVTGNKEQLQIMVGDGMLNGGLPKCSKCGGGYLHYNKSYDTLNCLGFKDDDKFVACTFSADPKTIKRTPWIQEESDKKTDA